MLSPPARDELSAAVEAGLLERGGGDEVSARLLADLTVTVMYLAVDRWLGSPDSGRELSTLIDEVLDVHSALLGEHRASRSR